MRDDRFYENIVRGIFGLNVHNEITIKEEAKELIENSLNNLREEERKSVISWYDGTFPRAMRKLRNPRVSRGIRALIEIREC